MADPKEKTGQREDHCYLYLSTHLVFLSALYVKLTSPNLLNLHRCRKPPRHWLSPVMIFIHKMQQNERRCYIEVTQETHDGKEIVLLYTIFISL